MPNAAKLSGYYVLLKFSGPTLCGNRFSRIKTTKTRRPTDGWHVFDIVDYDKRLLLLKSDVERQLVNERDYPGKLPLSHISAIYHSSFGHIKHYTTLIQEKFECHLPQQFDIAKKLAELQFCSKRTEINRRNMRVSCCRMSEFIWAPINEFWPGWISSFLSSSCWTQNCPILHLRQQHATAHNFRCNDDAAWFQVKSEEMSSGWADYEQEAVWGLIGWDVRGGWWWFAARWRKIVKHEV